MQIVGLPIDVMEVINSDSNLGKWIHNLVLVDDDVEQILKDTTYLVLYKEVQNQPIHLVQIVNEFLYLCKRNTCRMVITEGFRFEGISLIQNLVNQAHNSCGHSGVQLTYKELSNKYKYIW